MVKHVFVRRLNLTQVAIFNGKIRIKWVIQSDGLCSKMKWGIMRTEHYHWFCFITFTQCDRLDLVRRSAGHSLVMRSPAFNRSWFYRFSTRQNLECTCVCVCVDTEGIISEKLWLIHRPTNSALCVCLFSFCGLTNFNNMKTYGIADWAHKREPSNIDAVKGARTQAKQQT